MPRPMAATEQWKKGMKTHFIEEEKPVDAYMVFRTLTFGEVLFSKCHAQLCPTYTGREQKKN